MYENPSEFSWEVSREMHSLRNKLWKEGKIRIDGYTYQEWIEHRESLGYDMKAYKKESGCITINN